MDFKGLAVAITGGTGTLGRELARQLDEMGASIRIISRNEDNQRRMSQILPRCRYMIGDVRDKDRMLQVFRHADVVIHCAALKQLPTCEQNPLEAVKVNVGGSISVIEAALEREIDKVINISTDKAVYPISLYGATKLVTERLFVDANQYSRKTKLSCVRFGNYNESTGNVMNLWREQLFEDGEIQVTALDMSRFWINVDTAASFIIGCIERMQGQEIFIPKMPEKTLKEIMDTLSPGVKMKIVGRRPGEKLRELLWAEEEADSLTEEEDCFIIK